MRRVYFTARGITLNGRNNSNCLRGDSDAADDARRRRPPFSPESQVERGIGRVRL